ncbi:hypothetical protein VFPPC_15992 [Pochonia chlamydosporia 170]|uniref:Uncharacterized protein n=1 Tax=Pochonia chlamydosporia 170 TaxID=1380566 RepID=A0A179FM95_METCM|nr:hypothetical protein VFPPC_15992 [Pochonia chlamydosporia 170]OAQ66183.1 hypothetical protein VFPPC_15992 [Pochonia chlamydosporia 170]
MVELQGATPCLQRASMLPQCQSKQPSLVFTFPLPLISLSQPDKHGPWSWCWRGSRPQQLQLVLVAGFSRAGTHMSLAHHLCSPPLLLHRMEARLPCFVCELDEHYQVHLLVVVRNKTTSISLASDCVSCSLVDN